MFVDPSGKSSIAAEWAIWASWLPMVDLHLPIGDAIYFIGALISLGADAISYINYVGIDNIVRLLAEGKQALRNSIDQFLQGFNNNTNSPPDPNNWNHRDYYINLAENEELKQIISELYRKDAVIGDGGTADMLRYEYINNLELKHLQKATDRINQLYKLIKSGNLSEKDLKLAYRLMGDLYDAVRMTKGKSK